MSKGNKKGGFSISDPRNKSRDYWKNPTVLKIISSVFAGKCTKKAMNIRTLQMKGQKKRKYLPMGTLNKYLSGGRRQVNYKSGSFLESPLNVKDMIKEKFLIVENAKPNSIKRLSKSKEPYEYCVNYDLLIERLITDINNKIVYARGKVDEAQISFNQPKNKRMRFILDMEEGIKAKDSSSKWFQNELNRLKMNLSKIKHTDECPPLLLLFGMIFKNYYFSAREDMTLLDIFRIFEVNISRQPDKGKKNQYPKDTFLRLIRALNAIQDIDSTLMLAANTHQLE